MNISKNSIVINEKYAKIADEVLIEHNDPRIFKGKYFSLKNFV